MVIAAHIYTLAGTNEEAPVNDKIVTRQVRIGPKLFKIFVPLPCNGCILLPDFDVTCAVKIDL
jgi:hypothetical protein